MSTVAPITIPLVAPIGARYQSLSIDSRLVNAIAEKDPTGKGAFVYKRPGFVEVGSTGAGTARGIYFWGGYLYTITGSTLYKDGVSIGTGLDASKDRYYFAPTMGLGSAPRKLFFHNTVTGYVVDEADVVTQVTHLEFPPNRTPAVELIPGVAYLDGTVYVGNANGFIYGSYAAEDDAETWETLNQIRAYLDPDDAVAIAKHLAFVCCMKQTTMEVFYDKQTSSGSPLGKVDGAKINFGLVSAGTIASAGGDLLWVGSTTEGSLCVMMMNSLQPQVVSTPAIERVLEAASFASVYAWAVRTEGHRLYGLTLPSSNLTLVYDITTGFWYQWTDPDGNYLPYLAVSNTINRLPVFLHQTSGKLYSLSASEYGDADTAFPVDIYTPNLTNESLRVKNMGLLYLLGDRTRGSTVALRWSDDDYLTWSEPRYLDMALERPQAEELGEYTRRAFWLRHQALTSFRVEHVMAYISVGT